MKNISSSDAVIIIKAAIRMSGADSKLDEKEQKLLDKMFALTNLEKSKVDEIYSEEGEDINKLSEQLSSPKAKKAFLLTLAAMALADHKITKEECNLLEELTLKLNIGRVRINELSYDDCETMILKLLSDASPPKKSKYATQLSDFDML